MFKSKQQFCSKLDRSKENQSGFVSLFLMGLSPGQVFLKYSSRTLNYKNRDKKQLTHCKKQTTKTYMEESGVKGSNKVSEQK
jgi:hypothetical protein